MPAEAAFKEGQELEVFIESIDTEKRRLSLGLVLTAKPVDLSNESQISICLSAVWI